jgi:glycosyltransferase involved in cell wall biosynthesis
MGGAFLRIAFLGTRGIPGRYGGFETFAEQLSTRLVAGGHQVTVYCRTPASGDRPARYRGVRLVHLPAIRHKYAETLSHTLLSVLHAVTRRYDIVYIVNSANAPLCFVPWLFKQPTVLNVDGLEWERGKWGPVAKAYYRWAAGLAARMPIEVVTDARVIQDFYRERLRRETRFFPYGTDLYERGHRAELLAAMGLEPDRYLLYVSRMERENNALLVVRAYAQVDTELPLVMVGDAPYAQGYVAEVKSAADPRVRFLGYRFGDDYHALQANSRLYLQATEVGGTHPALVEALGHRNAIVAHDVPEHREVLGDAGRYFAYRDPVDLARQIARLLGEAAEVDRLRQLASERATARYAWDSVATSYEQYFAQLARRKAGA